MRILCGVGTAAQIWFSINIEDIYCCKFKWQKWGYITACGSCFPINQKVPPHFLLHKNLNWFIALSATSLLFMCCVCVYFLRDNSVEKLKPSPFFPLTTLRWHCIITLSAGFLSPCSSCSRRGSLRKYFPLCRPAADVLNHCKLFWNLIGILQLSQLWKHGHV